MAGRTWFVRPSRLWPGLVNFTLAWLRLVLILGQNTFSFLISRFCQSGPLRYRKISLDNIARSETSPSPMLLGPRQVYRTSNLPENCQHILLFGPPLVRRWKKEGEQSIGDSGQAALRRWQGPIVFFNLRQACTALWRQRAREGDRHTTVAAVLLYRASTVFGRKPSVIGTRPPLYHNLKGN